MSLEPSRFREAVLDAIRSCTLPTRDDAPPMEEEMHVPFADLGFDSLCYMEFCIAIQMETGVNLSVGKMQALGTPEAVVEYLGSAA